MNESNHKKVRCYLDQNVIDFLIKGNINSIQDLINKNQNSEIIYSYVTFREFARIDNESNRALYLNFLKINEAIYFHIDKNEIVHFEDADPFEQFNLFYNNSNNYNDLEDSVISMVHKILGGKKDTSFDEVGTSFNNSFGQLIEDLNAAINSLEDHPDIDKNSLKEQLQSAKSNLSEMNDKSMKQLTNSIYNTENPLHEWRKLCGIKVDQLNAITPPNVIDQIWNLLKDEIKRSNSKVTYNDLFGDGWYRHLSDQDIAMTMKVNGLYGLLNFMGYYPDKNIRDDRKFIPFINDQQHVGHAIYADYFITRDKRLKKKADAVYEHLKIKTKIIFVE